MSEQPPITFDEWFSTLKPKALPREEGCGFGVVFQVMNQPDLFMLIDCMRELGEVCMVELFRTGNFQGVFGAVAGIELHSMEEGEVIPSNMESVISPIAWTDNPF